MKWTGKNLSYEIFGESHSPTIGIRVSGLPNFKINIEELNSFMKRRIAVDSAYSTARKEKDEIIFDGNFDGTVSGNFYAEIKNGDVKSSDYNELLGKPRPSHADYASFAKFGRTDFRGGREFSGRMTAPLCIFGGIAKQILASYGIDVLAYVSQIGKVYGRSYKDGTVTPEAIENSRLSGSSLSEWEEMSEVVKGARENADSVGGIIECIVFGVSAGLGYTMAEGLESAISSQVFSVPAVKGIEFGAGFDFAKMNGSTANDEFYFDGETVKTYTNNSGGINGGISNGMPIAFRVAVRPTPSIGKRQRTVDLINKENTTIEIKGRHDACIVPRAVPVIEAVTAIAILDSLLDETDK